MTLEGMPVDKAAWDADADRVEAALEDLRREMLEAEWMPARDPVPQTWGLTGEDCLRMLRRAGLKGLAGSTAKDLKPFVGTEKIVDLLLAYRSAKGAEEKAKAKAAVLAAAPEKPPKPAPPWNFRSAPQVKAIAAILGYRLDSTNEAALLPYANEHPFFRALLKYRKLDKLHSTYGKGWFKDAYDEDSLGCGRVYPEWRQIGTETGRFASRAPNAQNLPQGKREAFVAPEGRAFANADYSQIEVRVAAKMLNETALLDLFDRGEDVYRATAANMLGVEVGEVTGGQRQRAKAVMLGMMFGMSAYGLPAYAFAQFDGLVITAAEAEAYVRGFYSMYPRIKEDHDDVLRGLKKGPVDRATMTGRRRDGITSRNEAINAPVQGTAADVLKAAMGLLQERLEPFGGSAFVAGCFHDELLVECEIGDGDAVLAALEGAMVEAMDGIVNAGVGRTVPAVVDGVVTKVWAKG
jgi:DNA polymerase I-like protein with 3'-5' exonuclease and polymerase domains